MRALAKDRDRRYQSAADLFSALEDLRGSAPQAGPRVEEPEPDPVFGREKELAQVGGVAAVRDAGQRQGSSGVGRTGHRQNGFDPLVRVSSSEEECGISCSRAVLALSSTARAKPTCRFWTHWEACCRVRGGSGLSLCCAGTRPPGACSFPPYSPREPWTRFCAMRRARPKIVCCGNWATRWPP